MATYYVATTGNDTTGDGLIGNPFATPGKAASVATSAGDIIYVKSGTYTITTTTPGAGGPVLLASGVFVRMEGYETTPGDLGAAPVLDAGAIESVILFSAAGNSGQLFYNLIADGNQKTGVSGFSLVNIRNSAARCVARDCNQASAVGFTSGRVVNCQAENCETGFTALSYASRCWAKSCGVGFWFREFAVFDCLASGCSSHGFQTTGNGFQAFNCTSHGNGGSGFYSGSNIHGVLVGCLASSNAAYGFEAIGSANSLLRCGSWNNTSGRETAFSDLDGIAITDGDPYVASAADDFRLNDTALRGALLRAAGIGVYGQTDSRDIGAVQHSGTTRPRIYVGGRLRT